MATSGRKLALFDFDGTITKKDTLFEVLKFTCGNRRFYFGFAILIPHFILYFIHLVPNWKMKELVITRFWKGTASTLLKSQCEEFTKTILPPLIRERAATTLEELKKENTDILVVTASAENWVEPWCREMGIKCIATRLEIKNEKLTGKLQGPNCNGREKVNRIRDAIDLSVYDEIIAYGDSKGDLSMLNLATKAYYKAFHD